MCIRDRCCDVPERETIERYITELHKKYKQKTVKRKIASVKAFYSYLEEEELLEQNPFRKIKVKFKETIVLPRIIPRDEIEQLLNYMYTCLLYTSQGQILQFSSYHDGVKYQKENHLEQTTYVLPLVDREKELYIAA